MLQRLLVERYHLGIQFTYIVVVLVLGVEPLWVVRVQFPPVRRVYLFGQLGGLEGAGELVVNVAEINFHSTSSS